MKKILLAICICMLAASTSHADIVVNLDPPATGNHATGSTFTTSATVSGATFDIEYTLNAFATAAGSSIQSNGIFGVSSTPDGTNINQQVSIDGGDGEQVSITGLSIVASSFNPGTSGLAVGDFSLAFDSIVFTNGTAVPDGAAFSYTDFDLTSTSTVAVTGPSTVDLSTLSNFDPQATSLFIQPDNNAGNNRFSISGISVDVTAVAVPEPNSFALLCGISGLAMVRRWKR